MPTTSDTAPAPLTPAIRANDAQNQADHPASLVAEFGPDEPLHLDSGRRLDRLQIAYQTYGTLNPD